MKAALAVKALRAFVRFIHEQADRLGVFEQTTHQGRHETKAVAVCASLFRDPDSFEICNPGRSRDYVGLEVQFAVFDDDPRAALFDTAQAALAEAFRIDLQWI